MRHALPKDVATVDAVAEASRLTVALADEVMPQSPQTLQSRLTLQSRQVNAMMKAPKKLEFEKVYGTMLLLSKKRYCCLLYAHNHDWGTQPPIDIKGLQSQRRDGCPSSLVRLVLASACRHLMRLELPPRDCQAESRLALALNFRLEWIPGSARHCKCVM